MRDLDLDRLATVQLVPLTPFSADGRTLLPDLLERNVRARREAGISVFLPGAGTSEFHSLSAEEVITSVAATRKGVGRDALVLAPIGLQLDHALTIGRGAIEAGADALLVMPPVHPFLSDAGLRDYFDALMRALPVPFLAYKKGPYPSDDLLAELAGAGQLVGIKYAVNDMDAFTRFVDAHGSRIGLYCGTAERFAPFYMLAGAKGFTTGAGNLCPRLSLAMFDALKRGDYAEGMRLLRILRPIEDYRARAGDSYNVSMLKTGLRILGEDFGPPRPPQRRLTPQEEDEVRTLLQPIMAAEKELAG